MDKMSMLPRYPSAVLTAAVLTAAALPLLLGACNKAPDAPAPAAIAPTELLAVNTPPPDYPEELLCDNVGGKVVLLLTVGPDGKAGSAEVFRSSGLAPLDKAAQEGVRSWTFKPATRGGVAQTTKLQVPVNFHPPAVRPQSCFVLDEQRRRGGGK